MDKNLVNIGFEIEYYSTLNINETLASLEQLLNKKILYFDEGHSDFIVTKDIYKLERDYSGGKQMLELITGADSYSIAIENLKKIFNYIKLNGYTTDKCAFQINISFSNIDFRYTFNKLKFILDFDENKVLESFENRKNNLYAKSIKHIIPSDKLYYENLINTDLQNYIMPNSKYYGVNFDKLKKNYLEFRYLGGQFYETKYTKVIEKIDYFIEQIEKAINEDFTKTNFDTLKSLINDKKYLFDAYRSYKKFQEVYPNLIILTNLINNLPIVEMYYNSIRDKIFTVIENGVTEGIINYNSDYSSIELKNIKLNNFLELKNFDLIECNFDCGFLENCTVFNSSIKNCNVESCGIYQNTEIENCKLNDCYVSQGSNINNCYIAGGKETIILGEIKNSIFRSGTISKYSLDNSINTEFIDYNLVGNKIKVINKIDKK